MSRRCNFFSLFEVVAPVHLFFFSFLFFLFSFSRLNIFAVSTACGRYAPIAPRGGRRGGGVEKRGPDYTGKELSVHSRCGTSCSSNPFVPAQKVLPLRVWCEAVRARSGWIALSCHRCGLDWIGQQLFFRSPAPSLPPAFSFLPFLSSPSSSFISSSPSLPPLFFLPSPPFPPLHLLAN